MLKESENQTIFNTTYESCFICQEDYNKNNMNITITSCNHKYHCSCLLHWLSIGKNCPYCNELLIENNIQAINMEDLRKEILKAEKIRIERLRRIRREKIANEIKPILRYEGEYIYWVNFKEYSEHYNKTVEGVKYFVKCNMRMPCEIINDGNVLKITGILSSLYLHGLFKEWLSNS
jgi:hypothetical protein